MNATLVPLMTTEQMLALPENGMDRDLLRGQLLEKPMTRRGRRHTKTSTKIAQHLANWLDRQPEPRGEVLTGDAGFCLQRDPDTTFGIDIAYVPATLAQNTPEDVYLIEGCPTLAVEVLSPSDTVAEIDDKISSYLEAGVSLIWLVDPRFRTVEVFRPGHEPVLFNSEQQLTGGELLPGFQVAVADLF